MDTPSGPTAEHRELYTIFYNNLQRKRIWKIYIYTWIFNWITLRFIWIWHNIVNQLYSNLKTTGGTAGISPVEQKGGGLDGKVWDRGAALRTFWRSQWQVPEPQSAVRRAPCLPPLGLPQLPCCAAPRQHTALGRPRRGAYTVLDFRVPLWDVHPPYSLWSEV